MSNPKTLSPGTLDVTLSGLINAYGSIGVYQVGTGGPQTIDAAVVGFAPANFTVHNTGTIVSHGTTPYDIGLVLGASGTVFNTGTIIAGSGIANFGTTGEDSLSNTGKILGTLGDGLITEAFANVSNSKYIYGHNYGLDLAAGGFVQNLAKATIAAGRNDAIASNLFATIDNAGTLRGETGGIFLKAGGTIDNTGRILQANSNTTAGAIESYQAGTVTNAGLIEGGNGIRFKVGTPTSAIYIKNTGTIDAFSTAGVNVVGYGGDSFYGVGVYSSATGEVDNQKLIAGNHIGVAFLFAAGTVLNASLISASQGYGVYLDTGGTVSNTGTIYGFEQGVHLGAASANYVTNSGVIDALAPPTTLTSGNHSFTYLGGAIKNFGSGTVINSGTVSDLGGIGIYLGAAAVIINSGLVEGLYGELFDGTGGVQNSGTVIGKWDGVWAFSAGNQITNSGLIEATGTFRSDFPFTYAAAGVELSAGGGTITNVSGGSIIAIGGDAIVGFDIPSTVFNDGGFISASLGYGVFLEAGGSVQNDGRITAGTSAIYTRGVDFDVYNGEFGDITAAHNGVSDYGGPGTLVNRGTIVATDATFITRQGTLSVGQGVLFEYGGSVTNASTGTIAGAIGIAMVSPFPGYVYNAGLVSGTSSAGIYLQSSGTVMNAGSGIIHAALRGVEFYSRGYTRNAGTIYSGQLGIYLKYGGTAVNTGFISAATTGIYDFFSAPSTIDNAGTIVGDHDGIVLKSGAIIFDTGTISGATYAISFASDNVFNRLIINAYADIIGSVNGGNGILELAADGAAIGSVSPEMQAQFGNFGSVQIDAGAIWDFTGKFTFGGVNPLLNDGTIKESSADKLTIDSPLIGTGTIDLSEKPLTLKNSAASTQTIYFTGTSETLDLADPKAFKAQIEHFTLGDTVGLTGITLSAITATHFAKGILTLDEGTIKLDFTFANPSTFGKDTFKLSAAAQGTAITLAAPAALLPVTHVTTLTPLATFA